MGVEPFTDLPTYLPFLVLIKIYVIIWFFYKYKCPTIQNKIILISVLEKLVKNFKSELCFSVLVDETPDLLLKNNLYYVFGTGDSVEVYINCLKCIEIRSLTGKNIAFAILEGNNIRSC